MMHRNTRHYDGETLIEETFRDVEWDEVRRLRDAELEKSDWRAVKDRVLPDKWKLYRQALRDITEHDSANDAVDAWPVAPDE